MLRLAVIGDVHDRRRTLSDSLDLIDGLPVDLALLVGDLGLDPPWDDLGRRAHRAAHDASVSGVLEDVEQRLECPALFVPGNHDLPDPAAEVRERNVDGRAIEAAGLRVAGFGGAGPERFGFPYEWSEEHAEQVLDQIAAAPTLDVLISHTPPAGTSLDLTTRGAHVGSRAVAAAIQRLRPRLFLCGHIHEAAGLEVIQGVPCLNAGALAPPAEQTQICLVDWENGPRRIERRRIDPPRSRQLFP